MRIGVLGTGEVGRVLGAGFAADGHQVMIGSRDPKQEKVQAWVKATGRAASAGTLAETAAFGELAVLATSWEGTESALTLAISKRWPWSGFSIFSGPAPGITLSRCSASD